VCVWFKGRSAYGLKGMSGKGAHDCKAAPINSVVCMQKGVASRLYLLIVLGCLSPGTDGLKEGGPSSVKMRPISCPACGSISRGAL